MSPFNIDKEKLGRALELVKEVELHLELLRGCSKQACPNLRIHQVGDLWEVDFYQHLNEIKATGESPGEALNALLTRCIKRMDEILSLDRKK